MFMQKTITQFMAELQLKRSISFSTTQVELEDHLVQKEKAAQLKKEDKKLEERGRGRKRQDKNRESERRCIAVAGCDYIISALHVSLSSETS